MPGRGDTRFWLPSGTWLGRRDCPRSLSQSLSLVLSLETLTILQSFPPRPPVGKGLADWPSDRHYPAVGMLAANPATVLAPDPGATAPAPAPLPVSPSSLTAGAPGSQVILWTDRRQESFYPFFNVYRISCLFSPYNLHFRGEKTHSGKKEREQVC